MAPDLLGRHYRGFVGHICWPTKWGLGYGAVMSYNVNSASGDPEEMGPAYLCKKNSCSNRDWHLALIAPPT